MRWDLILSTLAAIVSLIALVIGIYHVVEIKRTRRSLSTQYLGPFPDFLDRIVDVISDARHELVVFCDFPGYAKFSAPQKASQYQYALDQARLRVPPLTLTVSCLNQELRNHFREKQFSDSLWKDWRKNDRRRELVENYLTLVGWPTPATGTLPDLRGELGKADDDLLQHPVFKHAREVDLHMPMYFWIADKRRAVFSIPSILTPSHPAGEQGFYTSDSTLIDALLEMHERYRDEAAERQQDGKDPALSAEFDHLSP